MALKAIKFILRLKFFCNEKLLKVCELASKTFYVQKHLNHERQIFH